MVQEVTRHVERIVAVTRATDRPQPADCPDPGIASSWSRCIERYGIDPVRRRETLVLDSSDLRERRQRLTELLDIYRHEMNNLYRQIAGSGYAIILTDAEGVILDNITDPALVKEFSRAGLWLGAVWAEEQEGTNGIGTCLVEKRPVMIHQDEHFRSANINLTCSGAPIFDAGGHLLGVLDVSSTSSRDSKQSQLHTAALVTLSARIIENCAFLHQFGNQWVLRFHTRSEFIGMISEGMLAFDETGRILGVNQSALNQLEQGRRERLLERRVDELFELDLGVLLARSHPQPSAIWPVRDQAGRRFYALLVGPERGVRIASGNASARRPGTAPVRQRTALALEQLAGEDARMLYNVRCARRLLDRDINIILSGETGTGKELFARAIHAASARSGKPFLALNCAAIPEQLIESELFGYRDGAFTGARRGGQHGKLEQAHGGTLFLDEIGDMPLHLQSRLLRVLEERCVTPLGGDKPVWLDVYVLSASHRDLPALVESGEFREDLYYRLNGMTLQLPALRERTDFDRLVESLLAEEAPAMDIDSEALAALRGFHWPGNIRQLRNVLRTVCALSDGGCMGLIDLPPEIVGRGSPPTVETAGDAVSLTSSPLACAERNALVRELEQCDWNVSQAASRLGVSRNTLYRKLHRYGIRPGEQRR